MDTNTTIAFIDKAVQKTKSNELHWHILSRNFDFKPLEADSDIYKDDLSNAPLFICYSYYSEYKSGYLLLLVFADDNGIVSPPNDCILSLRIQENTSERAIEISNSQFDPIDASNLIRLYNLISDRNMKSVNSLLEDFLNS